MTNIVENLTPLDFKRVSKKKKTTSISRPSLSYWEDAWIRLMSNKRSLVSLSIIIFLIFFTLLGPIIWNVDPSGQDLDQLSSPPGADRGAILVEAYMPWDGLSITKNNSSEGLKDFYDLGATEYINVEGFPSTQYVRLSWNKIIGASGYRIYRNKFDPGSDNSLGLPMADILTAEEISFEDRLNLEPGEYWYSIAALDSLGRESNQYKKIAVRVSRAISIPEAIEKGIITQTSQVAIGDTIYLKFHPLGTDYLGRDMLSRLMHGARVSLFIGVLAPIFFVILGVFYGSIAGFIGGKVDQFLMRFADFVVALPFLLFMILFKIAFGIGPGESGVIPMLLALVLLSWPATARLVRGQILQIRGEGYILASQLLGAKTYFLILRHMIPNTIGVILVTLTFAIPSVIFVEAFLSFIGMGVVPPTPSWGSMCNEGLQTMLNHPHEIIFPASLISITVLAFNLLGDGLRDALDAKMRSKE
ncbi:MAG: hypothetical protein CBC38_02770 [Gammaproteobacteria bacterium TMED78]|nr:MAG: hypothetical protein CBC38_02770 [Gammaproteobacteria bacterium TMED78]|tara:strand:+ start:75419 stop:76840 length:1422 start_codon:yes stop_codon:yes gene_type:complete